MDICVSFCPSLRVCVSICVCSYLRRIACSRMGGLSGWIRQRPGAELCTIRIKVAISGFYLLRDVLCSWFWWLLCPCPLNKTERACVCLCWVTGKGPIFTNWPVILVQIFICLWHQLLCICDGPSTLYPVLSLISIWQVWQAFDPVFS